MDTKSIGDRTEAKVFGALIQVYPTVLTPFGENQRYDFVFEDFDGAFLKVQCKTGRLKNGAIQFRTYSTVDLKGGKKSSRSYYGEADFFGVSAHDDSRVYLVPVNDVGSGACHLRVETPKNGRVDGIRWADQYLIFDPCS